VAVARVASFPVPSHRVKQAADEVPVARALFRRPLPERDVNTWSARVGTPRLRPGRLTVVPTPDGTPEPGPGGGGFLGRVENTLDVEAVHGMAPGADIVSIGLSTLEGGSPLDSLAHILDHTDASIASVSIGYGIPPGLRQADAQVFQEGARQGVGFYFASGDGGTVVDTGSFLNPASSSAWQTSVGGREVGEPRPWYQRGVEPDSLAKGSDGRCSTSARAARPSATSTSTCCLTTRCRSR
jgi:hypothetical protein